MLTTQINLDGDKIEVHERVERGIYKYITTLTLHDAKNIMEKLTKQIKEIEEKK
jgi:ribosomal protein L7/L12